VFVFLIGGKGMHFCPLYKDLGFLDGGYFKSEWSVLPAPNPVHQTASKTRHLSPKAPKPH
jgi:hypothetical protein